MPAGEVSGWRFSDIAVADLPGRDGRPCGTTAAHLAVIGPTHLRRVLAERAEPLDGFVLNPF
jgi:hypothetical protein